MGLGACSLAEFFTSSTAMARKGPSRWRAPKTQGRVPSKAGHHVDAEGAGQARPHYRPDAGAWPSAESEAPPHRSPPPGAWRAQDKGPRAPSDGPARAPAPLAARRGPIRDERKGVLGSARALCPAAVVSLLRGGDHICPATWPPLSQGGGRGAGGGPRSGAPATPGRCGLRREPGVGPGPCAPTPSSP